MPLKPLRSGEYPKKKKKSRHSLALVFLSHSCVSSKMVADAISERGEAMALGQVAVPRWAPREHPAGEGSTQPPAGGSVSPRPGEIS